MKRVARSLKGNIKDPRVLQTMIICKQPKIGGVGESFTRLGLAWRSDICVRDGCILRYLRAVGVHDTTDTRHGVTVF